MMTSMSDTTDYSSDEDLENSLLRKCLDVELPDNFNPNIVPQNGTEFVQLAMWQAKQIKYPLSAPGHDFNKDPTVCKVEVLGRADCPKSMIPSKEWQLEKVEDFKKFQKYLAQKVPEEGLANKGCFKPKLLKDKPTIELLAKMVDNRLKYLEHIADELEDVKPGESITYETGMWLYNLMGTYNLTLCSDVAFVFRDICRKLAEIRSNLPEDTPEDVYKPLNLMICVISRCFGQFDLADE